MILYSGPVPLDKKIKEGLSRKYQSTKKPTIGVVGLIGDVGVARFELTASCSQSRRDTGLRYTPMNYTVHILR